MKNFFYVFVCLSIIFAGGWCIIEKWKGAGQVKILNSSNKQVFEDYSRISDFDSVKHLFPQTGDEVQKQAEGAIKQAYAGICRLVSIPCKERTYENTVRSFDVIITNFSSVLSFFQALTMVSPDQEMRSTSRLYVQKLEHFALDAFEKPEIYSAFKAYQDGNAKIENLTKQEQYFFDEMMRDFIRQGLHLPEHLLREVCKIKKQIATLKQQFSKNISDDERMVSVSRAELRGLTESFISQLKIDKDGFYLLGCDYPTYFEVMENCDVASTRKQLYLAFNNRAYPDNLELLNQIISFRDKCAKKLDFASYSALDIDSQMARKTQHVERFILELLEKSVKKEVEEFKQFTADLSDGVTLTSDGKLNLRDLSYVKSQYKKKKFQIDEREVANYFPLNHTIESLFAIYEQFLSVRFKNFSLSNMWHSEVRCIEVYDKVSSEFLGYIFLDMFPRLNKYTHACFVPLVSPIRYTRKNSGEIFDRPGVGLIIANFPKPSKEHPSLLKYRDVTTFFHEFGHAIHHILGKTEIASLSGTATKTDFVEVPSQMFEQWLWDFDIIKKVSSHYKTRKPLPNALIKRIIALRTFDSGFYVRRQCLLSLISLYFFANGSKKDTDDICKNLWDKYIATVQFESKTHFQTSFGHLMGYGAKYYSYLWSQVFAFDLFAQIKEKGLLNEEIGCKYVNEILKKGGAQDPSKLLKSFLGRKPQQDAFLKIYGFC